MIGYCCISMKINENLKKKDQILVNRGMVKRTFESKGLTYVSELAIENLKDTYKILQHNNKNNIKVYRMSSDSFPWFSNYNFEDLPNFDLIKTLLKKNGDYIKENNMRCGFHPGSFNVLGSLNDKVVNNTIDELNKHSQILDLMGLDNTPYYGINIHIGTTKPSLEDSAKRFVQNFHRLSDSCKSRLTVEQDDHTTEFNMKHLYDMIYKELGIPLVADTLHHYCNSGDITWKENLEIATSTWNGIKPLIHHSSSKKLWEDSTAKLQAHADYLYEEVNLYGIDCDIELECKMKDMAVIKYKKDYERIYE